MNSEFPIVGELHEYLEFRLTHRLNVGNVLEEVLNLQFAAE